MTLQFNWKSDIFRYSQCLYINADKEEKTWRSSPYPRVDSLMANHLNECIQCAVVALRPVDWVYYQEISIIAKRPFVEPLFKLFRNVLSCSAFTTIVSRNRLQMHSVLSKFCLSLFYFCGTFNLRQHCLQRFFFIRQFTGNTLWNISK